MSTPREIRTASGVEIRLDRISEQSLQFVVTQAREGGARWSLVTDLTRTEVAELYESLESWLAGGIP